jgi:hypothetical protein
LNGMPLYASVCSALDGQLLTINTQVEPDSVPFMLPYSGCLVVGQRLRSDVGCSTDGTLPIDASSSAFDPSERWRGGAISSVMLFDSVLAPSDVDCLALDCTLDTCGDAVPINSWGAPSFYDDDLSLLMDRGLRSQWLTVRPVCLARDYSWCLSSFPSTPRAVCKLSGDGRHSCQLSVTECVGAHLFIS